MNLIALAKQEIEKKQYRDETAAHVANIFFFNGSGYADTQFHVEFSFDNLEDAQNFSTVLAEYDMLPKLIMRKGKSIVYLKSGECLCNLLAVIGATKALMDLHNEIARRDLHNTSNRKANCDLGNVKRQVSASVKQIENIKQMQESGQLDALSEKLRQTAYARLEHPDASYEELAEILGITKSGVVNRLKKLI